MNYCYHPMYVCHASRISNSCNAIYSNNILLIHPAKKVTHIAGCQVTLETPKVNDYNNAIYKTTIIYRCFVFYDRHIVREYFAFIKYLESGYIET